jgi:SAM-dependent methyltransferase
VARLAKQRVGVRGTVVGVDRSGGMLDLARGIDPSIDWREGDASSLPLSADERFDAVFCHQGVQFFADKPAAIRAMGDALGPGGRVVVGVWRQLADNGAFHDLGVAAERIVGSINDARHSFGDEDALGRLLEDAGFSGVRVEKVTRTTRFTDARSFVQLNAHAVVAMSAAAGTMTDADKAGATARVIEESLPLMSRYADGDGVAFTTAANIAIGYR